MQKLQNKYLSHFLASKYLQGSIEFVLYKIIIVFWKQKLIYFMYFLLSLSWLILLFENMWKGIKSILYITFMKKEFSINFDIKIYKYFRRNRRKQVLTSLVLISSHPFLSSFRSCLNILKRLVDSCSKAHARYMY